LMLDELDAEIVGKGRSLRALLMVRKRGFEPR
jgi:hypothetical protein